MSKRQRDSDKPRAFAKRPKFGAPMRTTMPRRKAVVMSKETGYVDLAFASKALDTTGSITLIATVPQGASVQQRVGKKIVWKGMQIRGAAGANSAGVYNDCAWLVVYDRRPTGSLPAITDILDTATAYSMNNDANSGRFKILKRVDFSLVGPLTEVTDSTYQSMDSYLPLKGLPCTYKAAGTGAIADIEEGALYLVTVGSNVAGTTAAAFNVGIRTRFVDI